MWFVIITSLFAVLLTYLSKFRGKEKLFHIAFVMMTCIAAIHYDYGTDYMTYYDLWYKYSGWDLKFFLDEFFTQTSYMESGWILLNIIFGFKNGFFLLVALLNIIQNYVYFRLIRDYVSRENRWLAMFLYLFMDCLYLVNFSMMRQGFAAAMFVAAIMLMNKRRYVLAISILLFTTTVHVTAFVCIPFLLLYLIPQDKIKVLVQAMLGFLVVMFLFANMAKDLLTAVLTIEQFGKYEAGDTISGVGLGYVLNHIPNVVLMAAIIRKGMLKTKEERIMSIITVSDMLLTPLQMSGAAMIGRLGVYFMAFRIAMIPTVYARIPVASYQKAVYFILIAMTLMDYYIFFNSWFYAESFGGEFKTIFSVM